jgi:hypothetical protein
MSMSKQRVNNHQRGHRNVYSSAIQANNDMHNDTWKNKVMFCSGFVPYLSPSIHMWRCRCDMRVRTSSVTLA